MTEQAFCPYCGARRESWARFCGSCGREFDVTPTAPTATTTSAPSPAPTAPGPTPAAPTSSGEFASSAPMLAGIAWLITGGLGAYLAYQQLQAYQLLKSLGSPADEYGTYALVNAVVAAITFWFGARLITKPSRRLLGWSIFWAILSVVGGVLQLGQGTGNDVFALSIIASAAAGVLSAAARNGMPAPPPTPVTFKDAPASPPRPVPPPVATPAPVAAPTPWVATSAPVDAFGPTEKVAAASVAAPADDALGQSKPRSRAVPLAVVVVAVVILAAVGGFAILQGRDNVIASITATPTPVPTPTATAAPTPIPFYGTGTIKFGKSYEPGTLALVGEATKFKRTTKPIAWVAELKGPIGTDSVTFVLASRTAGGDETLTYTEPIAIDNPNGDTIGVREDLAAIAGNKAGTYVVRLLRGPDVLAEGEVTLTK